MYAELSWVGPDIRGRVNPNPYSFQHIAAWSDHKRLARAMELCRKASRGRI